jgi:hypothetical protein
MMMMNCRQYWVNKLSFNIPPVFLVVLPSFSLPLLSQIIKSMGFSLNNHVLHRSQIVFPLNLFIIYYYFLEYSLSNLEKNTEKTQSFWKKMVFSKLFKLTEKKKYSALRENTPKHFFRPRTLRDHT